MSGFTAQLAVVDDVADTLDGAVEAEEITRAEVIPVILTVLSCAIAELDTPAERQKFVDLVIQNLPDAVEESRTRKQNDGISDNAKRH